MLHTSALPHLEGSGVGWDGKYYTRSVRIDGKVVREYCGNGSLGRLAAAADEAARQRRWEEQEARQAREKELNALETDLDKLIELTDGLVTAALLAAGFHRPKRVWRKKRERRCTQD